jgi:transposase InsO family protein
MIAFVHLKTRLKQFVLGVEQRFKRWTKPSGNSLIPGTLIDVTRSKRELIAENALLRQQLMVFKRQTERPKLTQKDRCLLVLLASRVRGWKESLIVVKPETLLGWHRQGFRLYWKRKSHASDRDSRIGEETIELIKKMATENRLWGAKRIQGELLKLGIRVSKRTVQKYMRQAQRKQPPYLSGQTWSTFMANHASEIWACDFLQTYDLFFRTIFVFIIIELGSRKIVHAGVTRSPSDKWVAQQLREATPFGEGPRFLIRDNDGKYGAQFGQVAAASGIKVIRTPFGAPKANAKCERLIGSVRRECLDHILILSERHLRKTIKAYVGYYNLARPHQGIGQRIPDRGEFELPTGQTARSVKSKAILGGLHHDYRWVA